MATLIVSIKKQRSMIKKQVSKKQGYEETMDLEKIRGI